MNRPTSNYPNPRDPLHAPFKPPSSTRPTAISTPKANGRDSTDRELAGQHSYASYGADRYQSSGNSYGSGSGYQSREQQGRTNDSSRPGGRNTLSMEDPELDNARMGGQATSATLAALAAKKEMARKTVEQENRGSSLDDKEERRRRDMADKKAETEAKIARKKLAAAKSQASSSGIVSSGKANAESFYGKKSSNPSDDAAEARSKKEREERAAAAARGKRPIRLDDEDDDEDDEDVVILASTSGKIEKGKARAGSNDGEISSPDEFSSPEPRKKATSSSSSSRPSSGPTAKRLKSSAESSSSTAARIKNMKSSKPPPKDSSHLVNIDDMLERENEIFEEQQLARRKEQSAARRARRRTIEDEGGEPALDSDSDQSGMDDSEAREMEREKRAGSPDALLQREEDGPDPSTLCPFCSQSLPVNPSDRLSKLRSYLLNRPHIRENPSRYNPEGMRLPVIETASFCRMHDEESVVIPAGIARGWPQEMDWSALPRRIDRNHNAHLVDVIQGKFSSSFFTEAKDEWESKGARKMNNAMSEWGSFEVEQPGYYGTRGYEIINHTLRKLFITDLPILTDLAAKPLDIAAYLRRVLIPECAVQLIAEDLVCSRDEAMKIRDESRAYGKAMFSKTIEEEQFEVEELAREKRIVAEKKEKEEEEVRRKEEEEREKKEERRRIVEKEAATTKRAIHKAKKYATVVDSDDSDQEVVLVTKTPSVARRKPKQQLDMERSRAASSSASTPSTDPKSSQRYVQNMRDSYGSDDETESPALRPSKPFRKPKLH